MSTHLLVQQVVVLLAIQRVEAASAAALPTSQAAADTLGQAQGDATSVEAASAEELQVEPHALHHKCCQVELSLAQGLRSKVPLLVASKPLE